MNTSKTFTALSLGVIALSLAACAGSTGGQPGATADLQAKSGSQVAGQVRFIQQGSALFIEANVSGLTPGEHGFHIHESGDCSAPDATSAKGHFNPAGSAHGSHTNAVHHAGDMPNLVADASGKATYRQELHGVTLTEGPQGIVGRSVVIHADPDDYRSQPAGNSGKRVACGTIVAR